MGNVNRSQIRKKGANRGQCCRLEARERKKNESNRRRGDEMHREESGTDATSEVKVEESGGVELEARKGRT